MQTAVAIAIFWIAVFAVLRFLRRFPRSRIARLASIWNGPFPQVGELRSSYLFRRSIYSAKLLCQAIVLFCGLGLIVRWHPTLPETSPVVIAAIGFMVICALLVVATTYFLLLKLSGLAQIRPL